MLSDAAYVASLNKYILLAGASDGYFQLFVSSDGLNWPVDDVILIESPSCWSPSGQIFYEFLFVLRVA